MPTILGHPAVFVAVAIGINDWLLIVLCGFAAMAVVGIEKYCASGADESQPYPMRGISWRYASFTQEAVVCRLLLPLLVLVCG
jgi:hypothetical protein